MRLVLELVLVNLIPTQAVPLYLTQSLVLVLKYSSPVTGAVGLSVSILILPVNLLKWVSLIVRLLYSC